jgi:hypothetical protein
MAGVAPLSCAPPIVSGRGPNARAKSARFWQSVRVLDIAKPDACWLWMAGRHKRGYGIFNGLEWGHKAHRYSFMELNGPIPEGTELHHLCNVRHCVNPDHLSPVTHAENIRAIPRPGTCPQGHPFDEANTYITTKGHRQCIACRPRWSRT